MEKRTYPKLNIIELSKYIGELLLASEGSVSWIKEKRVIKVWHTIFFTLLSFIIIFFLVKLLFREIIQGSISLTFYFRLAHVSLFFILAVLFSLLMYKYYKHLLLTSKDVRFQSIVLFAAMFCVIFAKMYGHLYFLDPSLFNYSDPILVPEPYIMTGKVLSKSLMLGDFLIYSASIATNLQYPRILSASPIISVLNIVQSIISLFLVALVISTFVQISGQKKDKK